MLKDCLEVFKNIYEQYGDKLITDDYTLVEGSYVLVKKDNSYEVLEVSKKDNDTSNKLYQYFVQRDYLSKLIDMNKPIDGKKVVHSNNYLTFFIKKENINKTKLTSEIIDKYYEILLNPTIKYKDKNEKKSMYEKAERIYGKVNENQLISNKDWIKSNVFNLVNEVKSDKNYLKVFFEEDIDIYSKESNKYILPNIYNNTDFNLNIELKTYGLPNDNMGLNSKKPYLEQKTRKNTIPYLINEEEVLLQKKFFDYLMNKANKGKRLIYVDDKIYALEIGDKLDKRFNGYILRIQKGKEVEIQDFDTIVNLNHNITKLNIDMIIHIDYSKNKQNLEYKLTEDINYIENTINDVFFNKYLKINYFVDTKEIKLNDSKLKYILITHREELFTWFYKGNIKNIKKSLPKWSLDIIKNSILNEYKLKATEQFNLRHSLLKYFNGGNNMADMLKEIKDSLRIKINQKETTIIQNDEEYYFAIGQIASYLISLNKSANKSHSLLNPIINSKSEEKLVNEINKLFKKYNYAIKKDNKRFNNLYSMILGYKSSSKINDDLLIAGYLNSNLIYEKMEDKDNE